MREIEAVSVEDETWGAKLTVMKEIVEHHIDEEESEMFKQARQVFEQKDANSYEELPHVPSAPGAKTGILIPELKRLYVAVSPGEAKTGAAILRYDVAPAAN